MSTTDRYRCPGGQNLVRETEWLKRGEPHLAYANRPACGSCPLKAQGATADYRRITRWVDEAIVEASMEALSSQWHPEKPERPLAA